MAKVPLVFRSQLKSQDCLESLSARGSHTAQTPTTLLDDEAQQNLSRTYVWEMHGPLRNFGKMSELGAYLTF